MSPHNETQDFISILFKSLKKAATLRKLNYLKSFIEQFKEDSEVDQLLTNITANVLADCTTAIENLAETKNTNKLCFDETTEAIGLQLVNMGNKLLKASVH